MRFRNRKQDDNSATEREHEDVPAATEPEPSKVEPPEVTPAPIPASAADGDATPAPTSFLDQAVEESTADLPRRSGFGIVRKAAVEFADDNGTDMAAALTYYGVLSIFPGALAVFSTLGLFGQGEKGVNFVLDVLRPLVSADVLKNVQTPLHSLAHSDAAGATFAVGLIAALWSASAYVSAFGRAMNRVYEVEEGRPFWRLRPMNFLVTILTVVLCAAGLLIMIISGSVATSLGDRMGIGSSAIDVWNIAKWPVLLILVIALVALLYHLTPNIRQGRVRFLSIGACVAILVWLVASVGFGFYILNAHSYDRTYGSLAGIILALIWLWITNIALIFGAELDSELERARQLHRGIAAEEQLQLVPRSEKRTESRGRRREKDVARARAIRESRAGVGNPGDRPF